MKIHIDTAGMNDKEIVVAVLTEICKYIAVKPKKRTAKEIRYSNRQTEKKNKIKKKFKR